MSFLFGNQVQAISFMSEEIKDPLLNQDMILDKLEIISELHSGIARIQTVITVEEDNELLGIKIGSIRMLYIAVGTVRAGVDIQDWKKNEVLANGLTSEILPIEILDIKIDTEKSRVYHIDKHLIPPNYMHLQSKAENMAYEEIRKTALECGLLEAAEDNARRVLDLID